MKLKSTPTRYGTVAIAIHWLSAAAILAMLATGIPMEEITDPATRKWLLRIHVSIGVLVLALTALRIAWWAFADTKPEDPAGATPVQNTAAHAVHGLFYVAIVAMVTSGVVMMVVTDAGAGLFGGAPGPLPEFDELPVFVVHNAGFVTLLTLIPLHVAAALYHQFVKRDRLLARMGLGSSTPQPDTVPGRLAGSSVEPKRPAS